MPTPSGPAELGVRSLAIPAISTGVSGYPIGLATEVAVSTVQRTATAVERVSFVCFDEPARRAYEALVP